MSLFADALLRCSTCGFMAGGKHVAVDGSGETATRPAAGGAEDRDLDDPSIYGGAEGDLRPKGSPSTSLRMRSSHSRAYHRGGELGAGQSLAPGERHEGQQNHKLCGKSAIAAWSQK